MSYTRRARTGSLTSPSPLLSAPPPIERLSFPVAMGGGGNENDNGGGDSPRSPNRSPGQSEEDGLPGVTSRGSLLLRPSDDTRRKTVATAAAAHSTANFLNCKSREQSATGTRISGILPRSPKQQQITGAIRVGGKASPGVYCRRSTDTVLKLAPQETLRTTPHPPSDAAGHVTTPSHGKERRGTALRGVQRMSPPARLRSLDTIPSDSLNSQDSVWDNSGTAYRLKGIKPGRAEWCCQDAFVCISDFHYGESASCKKSAEKKLGLYGIFDGHGAQGGEVSQYCATRLPQILERAASSESMSNILPKTCRVLQRELTSNKNINSAASGTTACMVLVENNENGSICDLTVANVGDSRAILLLYEKGHWSVEQLSRDHKPCVEGERQRILSSGGSIGPTFERSTVELDEKSGGCTLPLRVWMTSEGPGLAMSRSLGDSIAHSVGVSCKAEVLHRKVDFDCTLKAVLVIASDGIFDVMQNEELLQEVLRLTAAYEASGSGTLGVGGTRAAVARGLCRAAQIRWLEQFGVSDDCSCVIVGLQPMK